MAGRTEDARGAYDVSRQRFIAKIMRLLITLFVLGSW